MTDSALFTRLASQALAEGVHQLVVGAVIASHGRVLLLRRAKDDFMAGICELPGGKVEPGETLDVAPCREVEEETGLGITAISGYLGSYYYASASGKKSRQFNFAATVAATEPVRLREHGACFWAAPGPDAPGTDAVKDILSNPTLSAS